VREQFQRDEMSHTRNADGNGRSDIYQRSGFDDFWFYP
jgi:hypothetical protein